MTRAIGLGAPEKARETKVAPDAMARAMGLMGSSMFPSGAVDGVLDVPLRSGLRPAPQEGGGGGLPRREPVDLVVHHHVGDVQVPPHGVDEVADADAVAVPIPPGDDDVEVRVRQADPGRHGNRPPVQGVHAVGPEEVGEVGRATDPGDHHDILLIQSEGGRRLLEALENPEVPASGAPLGLRAALVVLRVHPSISFRWLTM
jgi:hypothetical protein